MTQKQSETLAELLDECQEALDVLANDAEEAGYPSRAVSAADLAMRIRAALHSFPFQRSEIG